MPIFFDRINNIQGNSKVASLISYTIIFCIFLFPIGFLNIRHSVHISVFLIAAIAIYTWLFNGSHNKPKEIFNQKIILVAGSLSSITIATLINQIINREFHPASFDGPSKLLLSGLIFIYLYKQEINLIKVIELAIPIGLICLTVNIAINPEYAEAWGGRFATKFVDPNSLGSQTAILSTISLTLVKSVDKKIISFIKICGALCGYYITIYAQSRGGWVTIPAMLTCWLIIKLIQTKDSSKTPQKKKIILYVVAVGICIATIAALSTKIQSRTLSTFNEINSWLNDPTIYTSAGARMSMWVASAQLIIENPFGYGEIAIKEIALNHPLYTGIHHHGIKDMIAAGPHSDLLSKGLSLGLLGILSYLLTIFTPFAIFISKINNKKSDSQKIVLAGSVYITGIFVAGLFNETLSLKYLCSFYGLLIASFTAQLLRDNH